jgi:protein ImuA
VLIEPWGAAGPNSLTISRRLMLAADLSGVTAVMLRVAAQPAASAAETRWQVAAAPSRLLEAEAPGLPAFDVTLLRRRGGAAGQSWIVEWNRDRLVFSPRGERGAAPLSRPVVSVPAGGAAGEALRRTG